MEDITINVGNSQNLEISVDTKTSDVENIEISINENSNEDNEDVEGCSLSMDDSEQNDVTKNLFNINVVKQTMTSVTFDWNLISPIHAKYVDVCKIEKYHRKRGWEQVAWTCEKRVTIANLEENFAYRFRISALQYDPEREEYVLYKEPTEFIATTVIDLPSNISLQRAIKRGQQFLVKRILRRRPSLIEQPAPNGYLPLANAIIVGEIPIVDLLLTLGANVHIGNPTNGRTLLHLAFFYNRLSVARMLLNKKADLAASDMNGMTACHFAIDANHYDMVKFGLESGANLEASDDCGWTLLLRSVVMRSDINIVKLLVTSGANIHAVDKYGQNCVNLSRLYRNAEATQYFVSNKKFKELVE